MSYGISAGALIVPGNQILLVHHRDQGQYDFWVPPGGRVEGEESIFECAKRETMEEVGLSVDPDRIVYIQEFVEPGYHFCKFFILCSAHTFDITLVNRDANEHFIVDARFFTRDQLKEVTVYPEILKGQFWDDLEAGFTGIRYLGLERINEGGIK